MSKITHKKDSLMNFGKYRDRTVEELITVDPAYLVWAHRTVRWFKLDKSTFDAAFDRAVDYSFQKKMRGVLRDAGDCPYWYEDDNGSWLS